MADFIAKFNGSGYTAEIVEGGETTQIDLGVDATIPYTTPAQLRLLPVGDATIDDVPISYQYDSVNGGFLELAFKPDGVNYVFDLVDDKYKTGEAFVIEVSSTVPAPALSVEFVGDAARIMAGIYRSDLLVEEIPVDTPYDITEAGFLRIYAREGFDLESVSVEPGLVYDGETGGFSGIDFEVSSEGPYYYAEVSTNLVTNYADKDYVATVAAVKVIDTLAAPFNAIYYLDAPALASMSGAVPDIASNDGYVINLIKFPFKIPDDLKGEVVGVGVGPIVTGVDAPRLTTDLIDIDLGSLSVGVLDGTSADYEGYSFEMGLPFMKGMIDLDVSEVVGKVITATFTVDLYRGDVVYNIYSGGALEPIRTDSFKVGREIPIRLGERVWNSIGDFVGSGNDTLAAFIRVSRSVVTDGMFDNLVRVNDVVGNTTGYVEVENMVFPVPEVVELMKVGVIIR